MVTKVKNYILILLCITFILIVYKVFFEKKYYTKEDLIESYDKKEQEISQLINYFKTIIPDSTNIEIEFTSDEIIGIFHVSKGEMKNDNFDIKIHSSETKHLLKELNWTSKELTCLKEKLDAADCISISSGDPISVGWKRIGMGLYSYYIFDKNLPDSLITEYNDKCTYIFYKENIVFHYGGGAIGPNCFPGIHGK